MEIKVHDYLGNPTKVFYSEEEFENNADSLARGEWDTLSRSIHLLPDNLILKFNDQLNWNLYFFNLDFSIPPEKFLIKYADKINFSMIIYDNFHIYAFSNDLEFTQVAQDIVDPTKLKNDYELFKKIAHMFKYEKSTLFFDERSLYNSEDL